MGTYLKKLLIVPFLFISVVVLSQSKDTTKKTASIEIPLTYKTDTISYQKVEYDSCGFTKNAPGKIIVSGFGSTAFTSFYANDAKNPISFRYFVRGKEIKESDFIRVAKQ